MSTPELVIISDVNGVLTTPKSEEDRILVNLPLDHDPRMLDRLDSVLNRPKNQNIPKMEAVASEIIEVLGLNMTTPLRNFLKRFTNRFGITQDYQLMDSQTLRELSRKSQSRSLRNLIHLPILKGNRVFEEEENIAETTALKEFSTQAYSSGRSPEIILCTGISHNDRVTFVHEFTSLLEYITRACLRPGPKHKISGVHTKPVGCAIACKYDYVVLAREDDEYVKRCIVYTSPTTVFSPLSAGDAAAQKHLRTLTPPDEIFSSPPPGKILHNSPPTEMYDYARCLLNLPIPNLQMRGVVH